MNTGNVDNAMQVNARNRPKTSQIGKSNISHHDGLKVEIPQQEIDAIFSSPLTNRLRLRSALSKDKSASLQKGRFTFRYEEKKPQSGKDQGTRQLPSDD